MSGRSADPRSLAEQMFRSGLDLHRRGRMAEAVDRYRQALDFDESHFGALHLGGTIAMMQGHLAQAREWLARAARANPESAAAHSDLGLVLASLNQSAEAVEHYDRSITLAPNTFTTHYNRAVALKDLQRFEDALESLDQALALKPDFAEGQSERGNVLRALGRFDDAIAAYDRAIALQPGFADAYSNRGNALEEVDRLEEALASHDRAIALSPESAEAHGNRGVTLQAMKRLGEAMASYDRAIALNPRYATAHANRGGALQVLKRHEEALASLNTALALKRDYPAAYGNRANALFSLNRLDEAMADYDQSLALKPDQPEVRWNKSLLLLTLGDFTEGWTLYELRKQTRAAPGKTSFQQPELTGIEDVRGRMVFLHWEQGFGDTLQFCRYAPLVCDLGARVVLSVQAPLARLLSQLAPKVEIIGPAERPDTFDVHCALLSLPLAFGTTLQTIPSSLGYLEADPALAAQWRDRLGEADRPRIGLAWSGNPDHTNDRNRSVAVEHLAPLLAFGAEWICLQTEFRQGERERFAELGGITVPDEGVRDFADTAAIIAGLDLVISVDTSIAHLAGALGKPVWIMLPFMADFRWLLRRSDSPWYAGARLYRQAQPGDWPRVIARVGRALEEWSGGSDNAPRK